MTRGGAREATHIDLAELTRFFHLPITAVAKELGICVTGCSSASAAKTAFLAGPIARYAIAHDRALGLATQRLATRM